MKKWKCTVCGYIHEGDEPPDQCPVCGADKSRFVALEEAADSQPPQAPDTPINAAASNTSDQWRCTVCGYIHEGSEPPEKCPVCGADRSKFVPVEGTEQAADPVQSQKVDDTAAATRKKKIAPRNDIPASPLNRIAASAYGKRLTQWHGHPVAVHIPNGVLPMTVVFIILAALFKSASLATAAQYNIGFVALCMPIVIGSGLIDWVNGFNGKMTPVFRIKMICAGVVTLLSFILVIWGIVRPDIYITDLAQNWFFLLLHLANVATALVAGWYGGKLVFRK